MTRTARVRAPELPSDGTWFNGTWFNGTWFNGTGFNGTEPLTLASQRGRFVLLEFWTFCCANCLHVLDELRPLQARFGELLTVIGVHSPKFAHERDPRAVAAAIERYEVHHPVVNDPQLWLWQQYAVKAWPTLVLIDPEGYVVAQAAGEGQVSALAATIQKLAAEHATRGTLILGDGPFVAPVPPPSTLRFPAKAIVVPGERNGRTVDSLLVADAGQHALAELALDGQTLLQRIGSGVRGRRDGVAEQAQFAEPNGLTLLPPGLAPYDVVVADTANHVLRGVRLSDHAVVATIDLAAGLTDARTITGPIPPVLSPWDVAWWPALGRLVVAAAGVHLLLSVDPVDDSVAVLAGTTVEGLRDGPALQGWLAQPSGLAVAVNRLWFVDAETSALRYLTVDGGLYTAVGEGLFDFGHVDGPAAGARLQHPLGVCVLPDRTIAVLDTYNGAVRRYDPITDTVQTLSTELAEPSGAVLVGGELLVVESAAHRLVRAVPDLRSVLAVAARTQRPVTELAAGAVELDVLFTPAPGRTLDERYGPSVQLSVSASPPELLVGGTGESSVLRRTLTLAPGEGVLHVSAQAASCDDDPDLAHPACYLARQDWGVPVHVSDHGLASVQLVLLG